MNAAVVAELLEGTGMTWSWDIKKGGWNIKLIGPVLRNARRQVEILFIDRKGWRMNDYVDIHIIK